MFTVHILYWFFLPHN